MKVDTFTTDTYVVSCSGISTSIPLENRTFSVYNDALSFYDRLKGINKRIERLKVITQCEQIFP